MRNILLCDDMQGVKSLKAVHFIIIIKIVKEKAGKSFFKVNKYLSTQQTWSDYTEVIFFCGLVENSKRIAIEKTKWDEAKYKKQKVNLVQCNAMRSGAVCN